MNFQVPQFIEIEDKVIGPLSFKQFIYVTGAGGLAFVAYVYLPLFISGILIVAIMALGLSLAFYQVNNRPFIIVLQAALQYFASSKLYLWQQKIDQVVIEHKPTGDPASDLPRLSKSRLSDLSWSLDVKEKIQ